MAALALVLLVAGGLRLYALGVPTLLHDEALVIGAAVHDWGYILRRSLYSDAHPPFYYFLYKLVLQWATSDFMVRFVSCAAGVAGVFSLYKLGARLISRGAGLIAASLLAVDLLHVALSRAVRPHALVMLLGMIAVYRLIRFLDDPSRQNAWSLVAVNLLVSLWHFNGGLIIGAELAVVLTATLFGALGARAGFFSVGGLGVCLLVSAAPVVMRMGKFPGVALGDNSMAWTATRTLDNLSALFGAAQLPHAWMVVACLALAGLTALWIERARLAAVLTAVTVLPLAALIAMRYGIIYQPQHIAFIQPFLLLFAARGVQLIPVSPALACMLITAAGGFLLISEKSSALYGESSGHINHSWNQRAVALALPSPFTAKMVAGFHPPEQMDFIRWELARRNIGDPRAVEIGPDDSSVRFSLVRHAEEGLGDDSPMFGVMRAGFESLGSARLDSGYMVDSFLIPRTPTLMVNALPTVFAFTSDPEFFFSRVYRAHDVRPVFSPLGNLMYPSRYDSPASFTFRIGNASGEVVRNVDLGLAMSNTQAGNIFEVLYSFDGEAPKTGLELREIMEHGASTLNLGRTTVFHQLDVTVRMLCVSAQPSFYNNPETVRFDSMNVILEGEDSRFDSSVPLAVTGLGTAEGVSGSRFKWGRGPQTALSFNLEEDEELVLEMEARSPIPGQKLEVRLNDSPKVCAVLELTPEYKPARIPITCRKGGNTVSLRYALWNHGGHAVAGEDFEKDDPRLLAASFTQFRLRGPSSGDGTLR